MFCSYKIMCIFEENLKLIIMENTKKYYFVTDFRGCMPSVQGHNFHPSCFYGTQEEYDYIYRTYLMGREDEFKLIGINKYSTYEEYSKKCPILTRENDLILKKLKNEAK